MFIHRFLFRTILISLLLAACGDSGDTAKFDEAFLGKNIQAPTTPSGLTVSSASETQINLTWTASTDNVAVTGYNVYRGTDVIKTVSGVTTSDTGLSPVTQYCYQVSALDAAGNESAKSTQACATTASDTTKPTQPTGMTASVVSRTQLDLSWAASTDNVGVTGYKIYRGGVFLENSTTTTASDTGLTKGTQYCYQVSALDANNNESSQSAQACATTTNFTPLVDTGQTTVYAAGDDASFTIDPPSYTDNGNGTITDNVTGLLWQKQDDGTTCTWDAANTYCAGLSLTGTGWRVPTRRELMSIVDYGKYSPSINGTYFPNTQSSWYWSSTTYASNTTYAWNVYFGNGYVYVNYKTSTGYVRCVR